MFIPLLILGICGAVTVAAVHFLLAPGIEIICHRLKLSAKAEGQIIGYTTSLPEFVVVISAALNGVTDAGFWNIASSNIINWLLLIFAITLFKQWHDLKNPSFIDEIVFGLLSVGVPITLISMGIAPTVPICIGLFIFFIAYKIIDSRINRPNPQAEQADCEEGKHSLPKGLIFLSLGIGCILIAGRFLGSSASELITKLDTPSWLVGWILGLITSIPELTSFIEIYRMHRKRGTLHLDQDTQSALDALVASNMSNLGVILPAGIIIAALV